MTLRADLWLDPCHVVGYTEEGDEIEGPRWILAIDAPGGIEVSRVCSTPEPLERFAHRWAADRGIEIEIVRL